MSLKDKASRIKFPLGNISTPPASSDVPESKTKTAPGAMMAFANDRRSEMLKENEELKKRVESVDLIQTRLEETLGELRQWEGAKGVRALDPNQIVRSKFANRHELNYESTEFAVLKDDIASAGRNIQPIKVRPIKDNTGAVSYEIVFGHRRHEACRQLGIPVHAIVDNLDDQSLFVEMERENRARKDLSAWEQGTMYRRALSSGLFPSNRKLAEAIGADLGSVGKAIALADLPSEIVSAFASPMDLQFRWSKPLKDAVEADSKGVLSRAKLLASTSPKKKATDVFAELIGQGKAGGLNGSTPSADTIVLPGKNGQSASVKTDQQGRTLVSFAVSLKSHESKRLAGLLAEFLKG